MLDNFLVSCSNTACSEKIRYAAFKSHSSVCLYGQDACKFCKEKLLRKDLDAHLEACDEVSLDCEKCRLQYLRKEAKAHDCVALLRSRMELMASEFEEERKALGETIRTLSEKVKEQADIIEGKQEENKEIATRLERLSVAPPLNQVEKILRCKRGHPMGRTFTKPWGYILRNTKCRICFRAGLHKDPPFWNCPDCKFDICDQCSDKWQSCEVKCDNGHSLQQYRKNPYPMGTIVCDMCRRHGVEADRVIWHCRECQFDLCYLCSQKRGLEVGA